MSVRSVAVRLRNRLAAPAEPSLPSVACKAPFSSMYLDPRGFVRACCMNDYQLLGNITDDSLLDIWHGERAQELRRAMERHDLSIGCEFCKWQVDEGHPELAFSRWFEELAPAPPEPDWPQMLELSMSNTCNLQCAMCNAEWSSSIRTKRDGLPPLPKVYGDRFFEELESFLPHLSKVKFLGGEPFLASETLRVMDLLLAGGHPARVHVTTNGTQWSPRVERIVDSLPVEVAISLDAATPEVYEQIRIGSSWDLVMANLDRFQERTQGVTLTFCLMRTNWQDFGAFCRLADERGIGCAVNVVTEPSHLSLFHTPTAELEPIVAALDAEDRRIAGSLTLSRATWDGELDKLRRHLDDTRSGALVTGVHLRRLNDDFPRPFESVVDARPETLERLEDTVADLTERLGGTLLATIEVDPQQLIAAVSTEDVLGVAAEALVGRRMEEIPDALRERLGEVAELHPLESAPDADTFEVRFTDGTVLRAIHGPLLVDGGRRPGSKLTLLGGPFDDLG